MKQITETERLILRELTINDAPFMLELMNTAGWLKYIGDRKVYTIEAAADYIQHRIQGSYQAFGFGFYAMQLKSDDTIIGICGLVKRPTLEHVDIGFGLLPAFEGKNYGFEASNAVMDYAHNTLNIKKLVAITLSINQRSIKLLERLGLFFEKNIMYDGEEIMLFSEFDTDSYPY